MGKYECAMRECDNCPEFKTVLDPAILKKDVQYPRWKSKKMMTKNKQGEDIEKNVFGLYSDTSDLETVLGMISEMMEGLCQHIFISHSQWHAHNVLRDNLNPRSVITTEDYC